MTASRHIKPDLSVKIGKMKLKNPVMVASGTFGYGPEYAGLVDINRLGAVVVKGIMVEPWDGNPTPRMVEVHGGLVNAIGLQSPGVDKFIEEYVPFLSKYDVAVIVNVWGRTIDEYAEVVERLSCVKAVHGIELNISCPNIKAGGLAFGTDPKTAAQVVKTARKRTNKTLITKLAPNVPNISVFAKAVEDAGSDAIALINTIPAMVIDIETRKPVLANNVGGLSGPAIHPVAVKLVWEAAKSVKIPIIGMGGITSAKEAIEFFIAGATAVAVGTANFTDPATSISVIDGIEEYLIRKNIKRVKDLISTIEIHTR